MRMPTVLGGFALVAALMAVTASAKPRLSAEEQIALALAGRTPGQPKSCLNQRELRGAKRFGKTILYSTGRRVVYRMDTNGGCSSNGSDTMVYESNGSQLCRGDVIRTVDLSVDIPTGSCVAAEFVPYSLPEKPKN